MSMIVLTILQKVLVNHFYKVNAGFFLFAFFVLFGLPYQPLSFHLSIINGIVQSQVFLGVVMLFWLLYIFKNIDYVSHQINEPRQTFLFCLNSLPGKSILLHFVFVQAMVFLPVLFYALAIMALAASKSLHLVILEVFIFCVLAIFLPARYYVFAVQQKKLFKRFDVPRLTFLNVAKPIFTIPLFYLWHNRKQMLLITKTFSLGILHLFISIYEPDHYDVRPLLLCILLVAGAHSAIIFEIRGFEEEYLAFSKNLPLNNVRRFVGLLLMFGLIMLPEGLFLLKGYGLHFNLADYPLLLLMMVVLPVVFYTTLLLEDISMDQFIRMVFGTMAVLFFVLLYDPGIVLPLALLILCFALFVSYFFRVEKKV